MRRVIVQVSAATVLILATASNVLAGSTEVFRDRSSGSEFDAFTSEVCGFDVWLRFRTEFAMIMRADGSWEESFHAERFRTGPEGSVTQLVHYEWSAPDGVQLIGDPDSGTWSEVLRQVLHGSRVWSSPGAGVVYQDAGYYDATVTLSITPDGESLEVTDEVVHGQMPGGLSEEELSTLLCDTLG